MKTGLILVLAAAAVSVDAKATGSLRGLNAAGENKLWVINKCGADTALYAGPKSLPLDAKYTANGGAAVIPGSNTAIWVDANPSWTNGCFNNNCAAAGKTLAELYFSPNATAEDFFDISYVKGFNYPVSIEVLNYGGSSPSKVACNDPSCMDSYVLCDTAPHNAPGAAPGWSYPFNAGLTYKVTFCGELANTQENGQLQARKTLQQTLPRYQTQFPSDKPMVWCGCPDSISWELTSKVFNYAKYTQFNTADLCGPVQ